jgi:hypothetical protein
MSRRREITMTIRLSRICTRSRRIQLGNSTIHFTIA